MEGHRRIEARRGDDVDRDPLGDRVHERHVASQARHRQVDDGSDPQLSEVRKAADRSFDGVGGIPDLERDEIALELGVAHEDVLVHEGRAETVRRDLTPIGGDAVDRGVSVVHGRTLRDLGCGGQRSSCTDSAETVDSSRKMPTLTASIDPTRSPLERRRSGS